LKSGTWQGKEVHAMITTQAINSAPNIVCCTDDAKTAAETASVEIVMGAVRALCEFTLLVSQQNYLNLSLKALNDESSDITKRLVFFTSRKC
jgi:hypothetical protein